MANFYQKYIAIIILAVFINAGIFSPLFINRAKASLSGEFAKECVGNAIVDIIGDEAIDALKNLFSSAISKKVPTDDAKQQITTKKFELKQCLLRLKDLAIVSARELLKKRLLDQLVDQLVMYIQNPEDPRLVGDFGKIFEDAAQAAVGDTLREIGLGQLCTEPLRMRLELGLRRPQKFSQAVSCTLDQVVGNVSAFRDNFANGGWIGYQTLLEPQNNIFGLRLMVAEQVLIDTAKKQEVAKAETTTGYSPQKRCLEWQTLLDFDDDGQPERIAVGGEDWQGNYYKMSNPPDIPGTTGWSCTESEIVTPAQFVSDLASKGGGLDMDYILSADEAEAYLGAISDAILNRITTEVGEGLKGLFGGGASPPRGEARDRDRNYLSRDIEEAADEYRGSRGGDLSQEDLDQVRAEILRTINQANETLDSTLTSFNSISPLNDDLIKALDNPPPSTPMGLIQCQNLKPGFRPTPPEFNAASTLAEAQTRRDVFLPATISQINALIGKAAEYRAAAGEADTEEEITELSGLVNELRSQAAVLEDAALTTLQEVTDLKTTAEYNQTACNNF